LISGFGTGNLKPATAPDANKNIPGFKSRDSWACRKRKEWKQGVKIFRPWGDNKYDLDSKSLCAKYKQPRSSDGAVV
jgi:hypothetical protein